MEHPSLHNLLHSQDLSHFSIEASTFSLLGQVGLFLYEVLVFSDCLADEPQLALETLIILD